MKIVWAAGAAVLLVGCGGGGGGSASEGTGGTPEGPVRQYGPIETRGQLKGEPIVRDLLQISTVALAGTLTDATYRPQGIPDNDTAIVVGTSTFLDFYTQDGQPIATWEPKYQGAMLYPNRPRWTPDGQRVYFQSGSSLYYAAVSDPTTAVRVLTNVSQNYALSPDGTKIAFSRTPTGESDLEIFTSTIAGGSQTQITRNTTNDLVSIWADNERIIANSDGSYNVYGLTGTVVGSYSAAGGNPVGRSTDGRYFFNDAPKNASYKFGISERVATSFGTNSYISGSPVTGIEAAGSSPDGKRWVVIRTFEVTTTEVLPDYVTALLGEPTQTYRGGDWQPALGVTKFVGSGGKLGSTSAGIVATFRQRDGRNGGLSSFVNWDCQTRSTSNVSDDLTDVNAGTKTYVIEADRLTALRYGNYPFFQNISTVNSSGTANGAIVTVESQTGKVTNIVIYQETRGAKPTVRREGDARVLEGAILGVWNAKGENLAPQGTTRVVLPAKGEPQIG